MNFRTVKNMATLFLALPIPDSVAALLPPVWDHYAAVVEARIPREKLHLTLVWLGEEEQFTADMRQLLAQPLPQSFVPTVRFTHVGRGRARNQLWAYGEAAGPLVNLREQLLQRLSAVGWKAPKQTLRPFIPHMTIATLFDQMSSVGLADFPFVTSVSVSTVMLYKSEHRSHEPAVYSLEERISLV